MNNFHNEIQMLNVDDFQATQAIPWDQNQYDMNQELIGFGFGACFGFGPCFGFRCFGCARCANCFRCGRCHGGFW